jgi:hypothetical protein
MLEAQEVHAMTRPELACYPLTSYSPLAARRAKVVVILNTIKSCWVISETTPYSLLVDHTAPGSVLEQVRGS